jgi:hypothetical protein
MKILLEAMQSHGKMEFYFHSFVPENAVLGRTFHAENATMGRQSSSHILMVLGLIWKALK